MPWNNIPNHEQLKFCSFKHPRPVIFCFKNSETSRGDCMGYMFIKHSFHENFPIELLSTAE